MNETQNSAQEWQVNGFEDAVRTKNPLKISLSGPSNSGKTLSALLLASALGQRICVIDTENNSASLYADRVKFKTKALYEPYTVAKFHEAMELAKQAKCDVLIIDSISHEWSGSGGLLDKKHLLDKRPGSNSFTNFGDITKEHELFKTYLLYAPMHVICTMRAKTKYVLEQDEKGKSRVRKLGMEPEQREGMEYEFTLAFDLDKDTHLATVSKDRTDLFNKEEPFLITKETGETILEWWQSGAPAKPPAIPVTKAEWTDATSLAHSLGWTEAQLGGWLRERFNVASASQLTLDQLAAAEEHMRAHPKTAEAENRTKQLKAAKNEVAKEAANA